VAECCRASHRILTNHLRLADDAPDGTLIYEQFVPWVAGNDLGIQLSAGASLAGGRVWLDGADVTAFLLSCFRVGSGSGGQTFSCPVPGGTLSGGDHTLQVELTLGDQTRRRNAVRWTVIPWQAADARSLK
jgi:hypothetical protein